MVFASSIWLFSTPAITTAPRCFAVNTAERPTFPAAPTTRTRLARFDPGSGNEVVASRRHQRQRRRLDQIESLGNFRQNRGFHNAKFGVGVRHHCKHLVASGKAFHSGPTVTTVPAMSTPISPGKLMG